MPYRDPERRRAPAREATRRWYQRNGKKDPARRRQLDRERYAVNRESVLSAQWRLRNLERARNYLRVSRHKRRAAAAGEHFTFTEWEALLLHHAGCCAYCGSTERIEADQRIPLDRGGSNEIGNILPACRHCNRRKHRRTEEEFRALLQSERRAKLVGELGRR